ncbi:Ribonuclease P/MRP, subunit POP7 [Beauveria brongniartii RCEF 3172]|uniref:Ribonuclease P/MRP, subunit POP7 n=1 Tax=Beauveria brongniartii RCEF 3172 TaxID=1081107 RepID=A0A162M7T0_9HYPO|nr:Ribonuclease P/MRP, subunit POP7 [Beauveria brongniartii RCEF 3172]
MTSNDKKAAARGGQRRTIGPATKLDPIPQGSTLRKRPLIRRPLPASSKDRIIYVSSSTPFMSAVKRARKQLDRSLKSGGSSQAARKNASLHARIESLKRDVERDSSSDNEAYGASVTLLGTGRAVEKTLALAGWFEQQSDCRVAVRTRTVATVDDVVTGGEPGAAEQEEEDESRLRRLSCLEVVVSLK